MNKLNLIRKSSYKEYGTAKTLKDKRFVMSSRLAKTIKMGNEKRAALKWCAVLSVGIFRHYAFLLFRVTQAETENTNISQFIRKLKVLPRLSSIYHEAYAYRKNMMNFFYHVS